MAGVQELSKTYSKGIEFYDQGLLVDALAEFERVLKNAPEGSPEARLAGFYVGETHVRLAEESMLRGAQERAEMHLREAIARNPGYPDLHYLLAELMADSDAIKEAIGELESALSLNPDYAKALLMLGILRYEIGDYDAGMRSVNLAVEIEPRYQTEPIQEGVAAHQRGDRRRALWAFHELAQTNIDDISFHFGVGKKLYRAGDFAGAVESFEQALSLHEGYPDIRNWLGLAHMACGEHERAFEQFQRALENNPNYTVAIINAGVACEMMELTSEATAFYQRALAVDPGNLEARERLNSLGS